MMRGMKGVFSSCGCLTTIFLIFYLFSERSYGCRREPDREDLWYIARTIPVLFVFVQHGVGLWIVGLIHMIFALPTVYLQTSFGMRVHKSFSFF
jgi:hypothetical protein